MPRDNGTRKSERRALVRRAAALRRVEMGYPTSPRVFADAPTSAAMKAVDPALRVLIDEAVDCRRRID